MYKKPETAFLKTTPEFGHFLIILLVQDFQNLLFPLQTKDETRIWEKGEHNHSRDHRKTISVAAAKKIKATLKLVPVGARQWPEVCDLCHTFMHVE